MLLLRANNKSAGKCQALLVVIVTGNPGVFQGYPYPSKPVPAARVGVLWVCGFKNPCRVSQKIQIYLYYIGIQLCVQTCNRYTLEWRVIDNLAVKMLGLVD